MRSTWGARVTYGSFAFWFFVQPLMTMKSIWWIRVTMISMDPDPQPFSNWNRWWSKRVADFCYPILEILKLFWEVHWSPKSIHTRGFSMDINLGRSQPGLWLDLTLAPPPSGWRMDLSLKFAWMRIQAQVNLRLWMDVYLGWFYSVPKRVSLSSLQFLVVNMLLSCCECFCLLLCLALRSVQSPIRGAASACLRQGQSRFAFISKNEL